MSRNRKTITLGRSPWLAATSSKKIKIVREQDSSFLSSPLKNARIPRLSSPSFQEVDRVVASTLKPVHRQRGYAHVREEGHVAESTFSSVRYAAY